MLKQAQLKKIGLGLILACAFVPVKLSASNMVVVPSVAQLKALTSTNYDTAMVLDYYDSNPTPNQRSRGGGVFRWVTDIALSSEDGGRYIKQSNRSDGIWERDFQGGIPNVKMWGARGDGITDDTVAIQNAVKGVRIGANELIVPPGFYLITNTIILPPSICIRGEGSANASRIVMNASVKNKNIFETEDAYNVLAGDLYLSNGYYYTPNSSINGGLVNWAAGLRIENIALMFGTTSSDWFRTDTTGAAICLAQPSEGTFFRNIWVWGGGYGIRVLSGGTPGLKAEHIALYDQSIAGIAVEGIHYTDNGVPKLSAYGGPMSLSSINGDSFATNGQASQNTLILFTNWVPNATITDISAEGGYGRGVIRCDMPNNTITPFGAITVRGGTYAGAGPSVTRDFIVLNNLAGAYSSTNGIVCMMPQITMESFQMYNVRYIINDIWMDRQINVPGSWDGQILHRRPIYYTSSYSGNTGDAPHFGRSTLVMGNTAYYSFYPSSNGWYRVLLNTASQRIVSGQLDITSVKDSSSVSFTLFGTSCQATVIRKSSPTYGPCVTKFRGYTFTRNSISGAAVDVYVNNILSSGELLENRQITLSMPLGLTESSSGISELYGRHVPAGTISGDAYPSAFPDETYVATTSSLSLLLP